MPKLKRPKPINVSAANQLPQQLFRDGVFFVHGSNSASLEGVCRFRALLCMEDIDGTPWFHRSGGLLSGERGYTIQSCYQGQPIAKGVSLYDYGDAGMCTYYSRIGLVGALYPVLYGLDGAVRLSDAYASGRIDHPLSSGSIGIDHIRGIYVPDDCVGDAQSQLTSYGIPRLASMVRGASI
jgi:hypothetical protein